MTIEICRTVTTTTPLPVAFDYLADFTNTAEWDPGTVRTIRTEGDGGPGTRYTNVSTFLGRRTELTYVVEEYRPRSHIALRGENASVSARDTMSFAVIPGGGTEVIYRARFELKGIAAFVAPLIRPAFRRLGDRAERGLRDALDRLNP